MFQPERPPEIWSSDANRRAMWNGVSNVVEPVAMSPIRSVTWLSADSSVNGSNDVTVWLRFSASIGMFSTARWSAMKNASKQAASSRRISSFRCPRLKLASGHAPG